MHFEEAPEDGEELLDALASFYEVENENFPFEESSYYQQIKVEERAYTEREFIAEGGMKQVFKVYDKKLGRPLALARLKEGTPNVLYETFLREARLTALLEHPNIITVFDIGIEKDGVPFFTMELKSGQSLNRWIHPENTISNDPQRCVEIFLRICDAVAFAHSKNVIHLDLKPSNIQIGLFGEVVVCDWGMSKVIGEKAVCGEDFDKLLINPDLLNEYTLRGEIKGTPGYMAPEQMREEGEKTKQTDIYTLGILLFQMLSGKMPCDFPSREVQADKNLSSLRVPPEFKWSKGIVSILEKALATEPLERFKNVEELQSELLKYRNGYATVAQKANFGTKLKLFYLRNQGICSLCIVFVFILSVSVVFFFKKMDSNRQEMDEVKEIVEATQETLMEKKEWRESDIIAKSRTFTSFKYFENPKASLLKASSMIREAYLINPSSTLASSNLGEVYFMMQKLDKALDYFALSDHNRTDLHALSHEYVKVLDSSNSLLPEAYFIELLKKMMDNKWNFYLVERMIAYDEQQRTHPIHYDSIVLKCLERLGRSSEYQVSFNREERTLGLKGNAIFTLLSSAKESSQKSILRFLNLVELDLSHTSFSRLEELSDMQSLRELNISNTKVERLDFLNHMHVFRLHVAKNQFSSMQMEVLEDWIEVLEKE